MLEKLDDAVTLDQLLRPFSAYLDSLLFENGDPDGPLRPVVSTMLRQAYARLRWEPAALRFTSAGAAGDLRGEVSHVVLPLTWAVEAVANDPRELHMLAKTTLFIALLLTGAAFHTSQALAQSAAASMADAEVRKVDRDAKKITLKHGPIKNLDMPPMTMVFQVKDAALLDKVSAGDKVRFTAEQQQGAAGFRHDGDDSRHDRRESPESENVVHFTPFAVESRPGRGCLGGAPCPTFALVVQPSPGAVRPYG